MLRLGDRVTIYDGRYNKVWVIAGFDLEHNQTAADGTTYDNGYGICMIPRDIVINDTWNSNGTVSGGYISSTIHTSTLPNIATKLQQTVLGSHIVNRNVLLSSSVDSSYHSNAYTWTTAYATLMSIGQMTGTFYANSNKYDDGEANYKLPLFNYTDLKTGYNFWSRGLWGYGNVCPAWTVSIDGRIGTYGITGVIGVRPLIYLR